MTAEAALPKGVGGIELASRAIAIASTVMLMTVTVVDVTMRTISGRGIPGAIEITEVFLVVAAYFGLMTAARDGTHIAATLVTDRLPTGAALVLRVTAGAISAATLGVMIYATAMRAITATTSGEFRFGLVSVPIWPARIAIVLGLAGLTIAVVAQIVGRLVQRRREAER